MLIEPLLVLLAAQFVAPVRLNQVGYSPSSVKIAVVPASAAENFTVRRLNNDSPVLIYSTHLSDPMTDPDSGDRVQLADFSNIRTEGIYELRVRGVGTSARFRIEPTPYRDVLKSAVRAYYGQRCGTAVDLGGGYNHPACHLAEAYHPSSGRSGNRPASGGWHDAGDYGKYVVNSGVTMGTLLWAWELFPSALSFDLGIPESNDATPDFLNELRWNLRWMQTMQDEDGGVWHKLTPEEFPGFVPPHLDKSTSYVIGIGAPPFKSTCATADFAAVMAIASRVYRPYDSDFADQALDSARQAWSWTSQDHEFFFENPPGVSTGEYGDEDCRDEKLWAAAELFRTTGEEGHRYLAMNRDELIGAVTAFTPPSWSETGPLAAWSYALAPVHDVFMNASIRNRAIDAADAIVQRAAEHPYRIPLVARDYVWGSNAVAANYALQLLVANELKPNRAYVNAALDVLHYLLGRNTFSLSWVTGAGSHYAMNPHHRPSATDGIDQPWPGMLIGGPNRNPQDPVLKKLPGNLPPARHYVDDVESYAGNEIAINWNAPLVFILAGVSDP